MPAIKTARTVWLVRAGRKDKPENQEHFALKHNLAIITYKRKAIFALIVVRQIVKPSKKSWWRCGGSGIAR